MAEKDFEKQLELEALEKKRLEAGNWGADPYTYVDPNDGTVYDWDTEKQAWFPKVDANFFASYHSNYEYKGEETKEKVLASSSLGNNTVVPEKRKASTEPSWFEMDETRNTNVYVSGLPLDIKEEEFIELMSKCGLIMKDPDNMKYKIKLYRNSDGTLKGDGRCCYIKIESVDLALNILDGYLYKGKTVHVERAQFQLKGAYDPTKKPKKRKGKEKEKIKRNMEKLFDWRPDKLRGMRLKHERTVIIKNMFDPKEFESNAELILDYQNDVREECSKCGEVKKVVIYDRHPDGVVSVTFAEPEMADQCVNLMNGRWFASRQLTAETWDGRSKYKILETEAEKEKRLKDWDQFLEGQSKGKASGTDFAITSQNSSESGRKAIEVERRAYELAGETDSSGESDTESSEAVSSSSNFACPVMQSSGNNKGFFQFPTSQQN